MVGSKWGYTYTAEWQTSAKVHEVKDHSETTFQRQWQQTKSNLGEFLDLYQIHSATLESGVLENAEVLRALAQRKQEGLRIGLSLSGPKQKDTLDRALEVQIDGVALFDSVQATFNILEVGCQDALARAKQAGLQVIVKEALANGRLTSRNDLPADASALAIVDGVAGRLICSRDALALAFALCQPWGDIVLCGATTREQLDSNLAARRIGMSAALQDELRACPQPSELYWQIRGGLPWQ